uniref:Uncharacterized protein LOC105056263 n=2 Tax=Elaeis guineensis var. tenera TaxID=51953 RepID=A0A8N4IGW7_ELAGV
MSASINNIAATFAAASGFPPSSSSSPPPQSSSSSPAVTAAFFASLSPSPACPIFATWNPQSSLPPSHCSSLLGLYGLPGPRPHPFLRLPRAAVVHPSSVAVSVGDRLPDAALSYLDRGGAIRTVALAELTRARKAVIMAVPGAFFAPPRPR